MFEKIISFSVHNRFLILLGTIFVVLSGVYSFKTIPVDAFPDISPVMVPVFAEAHGLAPEEVERLVTIPVESRLNGLPGVSLIKSTSAFGLGVIYVYFSDDTDVFFARQLVAERLSDISAELDFLDEKPVLGPISTGLGQIFLYYLTIDKDVQTSGKDPLTYLREVNDWIVKYQLLSVRGVADVLSIGGHVLEYQIQLNQDLMKKYNVSFSDAVMAIRSDNASAGGQYIRVNSEEYLVRGSGLLTSLDDIKKIRVTSKSGIPLTVDEIADVNYGNSVRRGVVTRNGSEEIVSGMILKLYGENTSQVISRLYERVSEISRNLPPGIKIVPYYEQADLVRKATGTVTDELMKGAFLVIAVLFMFLGNFFSSVVVAFSLPFCALAAFCVMKISGISANLMSLGGIAVAIGMLGDGATVLVENVFRQLKGQCSSERNNSIISSSTEVARPVVFSLLIVMLVFLPLFALEGVEGKMFKPMAVTLCLALGGSVLFTLLISPAMCTFFPSKKGNTEAGIQNSAIRLYQKILNFVLNIKMSVLSAAIAVFVVSITMLFRIGTEFIPSLDEGSILITVSMAPSISLENAVETISSIEKKIMTHKQVREVISRTGRPEAGTHPHPVNYAEVQIQLKTDDHKVKIDLLNVLKKELSGFSGVSLNYSQPVQNAFDELLSGIKAQLAVKIFGDNSEILQKTAGQIRESIESIPGLQDISIEQSSGQPQIVISADRAACSSNQIRVSDIMEFIEISIGGKSVNSVYQDSRKFDVSVRLAENFRNSIENLNKLQILNENKVWIPLNSVAEIRETTGPAVINRENGKRRWVVQANIRNRDTGSTVADIRDRIFKNVRIPEGYMFQIGGQYENQQRAMKKLMLIIPAVILLIFFLLIFSFESLKDALIIILNVPLALIGGVAGLMLMKEYLSVPAAVGFIVLFGTAIQDGMVLVSCMKQLSQSMNIREAVIKACSLRLRPVLMTSLTTVFGLMPLLFSSGTGAEIQRPLAAVVVFGLISSTVLTLIVLPSVFLMVYKKELP